MTKRIITVEPIEQQASPEAAEPAAQSKPKFNANAARKHKLTGSLVALLKRSDGWVAVCETHNTISPSQPTRESAERLRVAGTFCSQCLLALSERAGEPAPERASEPAPERATAQTQVTTSESTSPSTGDATQTAAQAKPKQKGSTTK